MKRYGANVGVALQGKGGVGGRVRLGLWIGFRILRFQVVVVGRLSLLGGTIPALPVPIFVASAACRRRRRLRRKIYNVNLRRGNEEMVCHCAIFVDRRRINDTLNRFSVPGE